MDSRVCVFQSWSKPVLDPVEVIDGVRKYTFTTVYSAKNSDFQVTLRGMVSDGFLHEGNFTLAANTFKFDLRIDNITYTQPNSTLGIVMMLQSVASSWLRSMHLSDFT